MGLPWVRLDTTMPDNPKILGLLTERDGHRAAFVWICCLTYAGRHETHGFIPREALTSVNARTADMTRLANAGLLTANAGGWDIHDWDEYQISTATTQARREQARRAAAARWSRAEANGAPQ